MKKIISLSALAGSILLLGSCSVTKDSISQPENANFEGGKDAAASCFIIKKDGSTIPYQSLRQVNSVFHNAYLLADGKTRIYPDEIKAYQTTGYYAVSQTQFANGRKSTVSRNCLPGFAIRIVRGKLNLYCKQFYNGANSVDEFYLQNGDAGKIEAYSPKLMAVILKDNPDAARFFDNNKKLSLARRLTGTVAIINNDHIAVTKN